MSDAARSKPVAERRVRAFEMRKRGATYREIAQELHVDVHTIHGDIQAELNSLRETAIAIGTPRPAAWAGCAHGDED